MGLSSQPEKQREETCALNTSPLDSRYCYIPQNMAKSHHLAGDDNFYHIRRYPGVRSRIGGKNVRRVLCNCFRDSAAVSPAAPVVSSSVSSPAHGERASRDENIKEI